MPMPRLQHPIVVWEVRLPLELAAKIELILLDPMTKHAKQGARGKLVEGLLREWLERQIA